MGAFGEKLRKQREQRGISLDAVCATTKISIRMLRAIEDERFDQLPGGVFNKGFVRAYARQVGLDEDEAIADYLAALGETQIHSQTIPNFRTPAGKSITDANATNPRTPDHSSDLRGDGLDPHNPESPAANRRTEARRKETRRREDREFPPHEARLSADRLSVDRRNEDRSDENLDEVVSSSPLTFSHLTSEPSSAQFPPRIHSEPIAAAAPISVDDSTPRVPWVKLAAALLLITLALALWTLRRHNQSAAASQPAASHSSPAPVAALASVAPARPSLAAASTAAPRLPKPSPSTGNSTANTPAPNVNPPATKPSSPAAAQSPLTFTLLIRADQTSWIAITADGQPVAKETLIAPAHTSVRAAHDITVKAGNAAGISFLFNGEEIPASGNPGEVRTYTFDASGVKASSAAPTPDTSR